jgi:hypothetical protein
MPENGIYFDGFETNAALCQIERAAFPRAGPVRNPFFAVYMEAVNPYQSGTWPTEGRWVTSASLTLSESPCSGSKLQPESGLVAHDQMQGNLAGKLLIQAPQES